MLWKCHKRKLIGLFNIKNLWRSKSNYGARVLDPMSTCINFFPNFKFLIENFSKKRKKGKGKNKGNEQVIDMSQFQNIGDEEEKEKEPKEEEKEKEKLGSLHFSLGKFVVLPYSPSFYKLL